MSVRTAAASSAAAILLGACALLPAASQTQAAALRGGPVVFGHRGASAYAPENTLEAVDAAEGLGIDWVENDVQLTRDGVPIVMHDANLKRTTDAEQVFPGRAPWAVKDFTAAEIARLDAGSWFGGQYAGARVPTLARYLERVERNDQNLLLEVKNPRTYPGIEKKTLRVLRDEGWLDRTHVDYRLVIQSLDADSVRTVRRQRPDVTTGFLGTPAVADLPSYAVFTDRINPLYSTISADYVAEVHRLKGVHGKRLQVDTWTVNDAAAAKRVEGYGVDGIISNRPDVVRGAVRP